jgi:hypothetical protein
LVSGWRKARPSWEGRHVLVVNVGHVEVTRRRVVDGCGGANIGKFITEDANVGLDFVKVGRAQK